MLKGVGAAFSALGSIAVVGGLLILIFIDVYKTRAIIRYGKFTSGIVVKFYSDYRGNGSVEYTYEVKGTKYVGTSTVNNFRPNKGHLLEGLVLPVKYDIHEVQNAYMIVTPGDFKINHISFPDSLNWMRQYVN